jgi:hypothetical protein
MKSGWRWRHARGDHFGVQAATEFDHLAVALHDAVQLPESKIRGVRQRSVNDRFGQAREGEAHRGRG